MFVSQAPQSGESSRIFILVRASGVDLNASSKHYSDT